MGRSLILLVILALGAVLGTVLGTIPWTRMIDWIRGTRIVLVTSSSQESRLILGLSRIEVPAKAIVGVQVNRVIRDIAWKGSRWDEKHVSASRLPTKPEDLVPYMEGARVAELMRYARVRVIPLAPGTAKLDPQKKRWYAPDADGIWRFEVDPSKIEFPSVKRTIKDVALMPDTHGFNSIAEQAARMRNKPFLVVACMDLSSKAEAALYLAKMGVHAYAPGDRFGFELLGYRKFHPRAATIIGTAPIRQAPNGAAVIGDQPVAIAMGETVVVQTTDKPYYPWQYADAPQRYFTRLLKEYPQLKLQTVVVVSNPGELEKLLNTARSVKARVVAVRVGKSSSDEEAVKDARVLAEWLKENPQHRAILFHTALYEPGYKLFFDFPKQVTFGDLDPVVR